MKFPAPFALLWILTACAVAPAPPVADQGGSVVATGFPPRVHERGVARSNTTIASQFLQLTFFLESGQPIPQLLRYEVPVRVYLRSPGLSDNAADLEALLARLRSEAGIDIARTTDEAAANLFIEEVPPAGLRRAVPGAACFLAPGVQSWAEYTAIPRGKRPRWSQQTRLTYSSVFIPSGIAPQETRDCFHEEIGQSLGPVNDMYELPDSVFNDDNMHSVLTAFDMVILRALYSPDLSSGMSRAEVAARIPGVLAEVNPKGAGLPPYGVPPTPPAWRTAIEATLSAGASDSSRVSSGKRAVEIARQTMPGDHRLALSDLALGRLLLKEQPERAATLFFEAYDVSLSEGDPVRSAHAALHVSVIALSLGQFEAAIEIANRHLPDARMAENATLVSGFQAVRAEALKRLGRDAEARAARQESLGLAAYAFGTSQDAIAAAQAQIANLATDKEKSQ